MILSDRELIARSDPYPLVEPFVFEHVQPASIDLTLDSCFLEYVDDHEVDLDDVATTKGPLRETISDSFRLAPKAFVLGSTRERTNVPPDLVGIIEGKSSLARLGLLVHITAGYCDPGFQGKVTLEFFNVSHRPIILRAGRKICQVTFTQLGQPAERPYGSPGLNSKYQNQTATTSSRYVG